MSIYRGLVRPRMEYASHMWQFSMDTALLDKVKTKTLRLIISPPLTDNLLPLKFRRHVPSFLSSIVIFPLTALLNLLT